MERGHTLFLKGTVLVLALPILALLIFGLPMVAREGSNTFPDYWLYTVIGGMYASAVPYFYALYQTMNLLRYIDKNQAFSELSVLALKRIKYCAVAIGLIYLACFPFFFLMGDDDDAPGLIVIGMLLVFAPAVIAVFAAVLQKLLRNAIDIKSENDLTI